MISAQNVTVGYEQGFRLSDVSFEIPAGGFWGIVGPNGSGKSTLLKALSKILKLQSGRILIKTQELRQIPLQLLARTMAVVGSEAQFAFPFRVQDVVLMGRFPFKGKLGGYNEDDYKVVEESLSKTEATHFKNRFIHQLSSGERQRVLLARALAQQPSIILLDEPTAHLDLHFEIEIFQILKTLNQQEKLTIVTVSHNLNLIAEFCDTVMLMNAGKLRKSGPPNELFTEELIREIFKVDAHIHPNPFSGAPSILIKAQEKRTETPGEK